MICIAFLRLVQPGTRPGPERGPGPGPERGPGRELTPEFPLILIMSAPGRPFTIEDRLSQNSDDASIAFLPSGP